MKKKFTFLIAAFALLTIMVLPGKAVGQREAGTVTITRNSFGSVSGGYSSYDWSANDVSGKGQIYATTTSSIQMNGGNNNGKFIYNTTAVPGPITNVNIIQASGTARSYSVYGRTTAYSGSGDYGTLIKTATISTGTGTDYSVSSGEYQYFVVVNASSNAAYLASITISYGATTTYSVTCATDLTNGSISASPTSAAQNETVTITAIPETNYQLSSVTISKEGGGSVSPVSITGNTATFTMPADNVNVSATFARIYTIACEASSNGSISADLSTAFEDDVITITAAPDAGYNFGTITVAKNGGGTIDADDIIYEGNTAAFEMPADNVTVSATFTAKTTRLIMLVASPAAGGTVTTNVTNDLAYEGQIVTLTASPNTNYTLSTLSATYVDGEETQHDLIINSSNQFTMPAYPVTVTAAFAEYHAYVIDFESELSSYVDWEFDSGLSRNNNSSQAHGGGYYGINYNGSSATTSGTITTKYKIAQPGTLKFYAKRTGSNTKTANWRIYTSTDGSSWTERRSFDATPSTWTEYSIDLSSYTNSYIRIKYDGNNAQYRCVDDISLEYTPVTYAVTLSAVSNGTISASDGTTTITSGSNNFEIGKTITLTAEGDATHMFSAWSVTGATVADASSAITTFEMPADAVTVSATFVDSWSFTYNINGNTVTEKYARNDATITLPTTSEYCPEGYSIRGWTETESDLSSPITSAIADKNRTFYAIFGKNVYGDFVKVTTGSTTDDWTGHYLIVYGTDSYAFDGSLETLDKTFNNIPVTISNNKIVRDNTTEASMFTIASNGENKYSIRSASGYYIGGTSSGTLNQTTDNTTYQHDISVSYSTAIIKCGSNFLRVNSNNDQKRFRYYSTNSTTVQLYKLEVTLSGSYTRVYTKDITGFGEDNTVKTGWNLIASPFSSITPSPDNGFITNTYDLYAFDQTGGTNGKEWKNWQQEGGYYHFNLVNGQGYLYANSDDAVLTFAGTPCNSDGVIDLIYSEDNSNSKMWGWNLVGNPFAYAAYVNKPFYKMNADGDGLEPVSNYDSYTTAQSIPALTGIFVHATETGQTVTFSETEPELAAPNNGNVQIALAQIVATRGESSSKTLDNAIVSFNEGSKLPKFYFGTQNANIYIPQDGEEYAIVSAEAQGEMPVNFKAQRDGQYTITVNPEEVEMGYLHLIDNIAGVDVDLIANPSYSFNAKADDYESRFRLVFSANIENEIGNGNDEFAFFSNGQLIVTGEGTLQVVDMMGRVISTEMVNGTTSKAINAKAGVYVLRLTNGENVKTQKIVVR